MKNNPQSYIREAYHAGSWYEDRPTELEATLTSFLSEATGKNSSAGPKIGIPRGVIVPHAGYRYSGPTAAYAYSSLMEALLIDHDNEASGTRSGGDGGMTIVVLHPSHHEYLNGCAISGASLIQTPLGDLAVDEVLRSELLATGEFSVMRKETDEKEHSGEMQYPFIQKVVLDAKRLRPRQQQKEDSATGTEQRHHHTGQETSVRVLPIMVGAVHNSQEIHFGKVLAPFLSRPQVFTVISSDFCHWGRRFGYTPTSPPDHIKVNKRIQDIHEYVSISCMSSTCLLCVCCCCDSLHSLSFIYLIIHSRFD
jgi:predicted class III extradiol MEMO1 family dioxygenase